VSKLYGRTVIAVGIHLGVLVVLLDIIEMENQVEEERVPTE